VSKNAQVSGRQIAAARTLIGLDQASLAKAASISVQTLRRMEAADGVPGGFANNIVAVIRVLEAAGVEFIAENGGGAGVRLRK
jgi:DNA-binding transcriptional regulator YiaG